jgi:hypothetical protein
VNVAIHEMAHALEHESFMDETTVDKDFKTDFARFSTVCGPAFASAIVQTEAFCAITLSPICRNFGP